MLEARDLEFPSGSQNRARVGDPLITKKEYESVTVHNKYGLTNQLALYLNQNTPKNPFQSSVETQQAKEINRTQER